MHRVKCNKVNRDSAQGLGFLAEILWPTAPSSPLKATVFSRSVGRPFVLLVVSFAVRNVFSLIRSYSFIFVKWNKSDAKCQKPYDFTHMWGITLKTTNSHRRRQQCGGYQRGRGWGDSRKGKGGHMYGDGRDLTLRGEHARQRTADVL